MGQQSTSRYEWARDQLNVVLSFFPRVEAKLSLVLAVDSALLGLLAANAPAWHEFQGYMVFAAIPAVLIGASLIQVYQGSFPNLEGGHKSLVYFREIAMLSEPQFIQEYQQLSEQELVQDLLSQAWRNSCILRSKFDRLKTAFQLTAWALIPWAVSLALFAASNESANALIRN